MATDSGGTLPGTCISLSHHWRAFGVRCLSFDFHSLRPLLHSPSLLVTSAHPSQWMKLAFFSFSYLPTFHGVVHPTACVQWRKNVLSFAPDIAWPSFVFRLPCLCTKFLRGPVFLAYCDCTSVDWFHVRAQTCVPSKLCLLIFILHPFLEHGLCTSLNSTSITHGLLANLDDVLTFMFHFLPLLVLPLSFIPRNGCLHPNFAGPAMKQLTFCVCSFVQRSQRRSRKLRVLKKDTLFTVNQKTSRLSRSSSVQQQTSRHISAPHDDDDDDVAVRPRSGSRPHTPQLYYRIKISGLCTPSCLRKNYDIIFCHFVFPFSGYSPQTS